MRGGTGRAGGMTLLGASCEHGGAAVLFGGRTPDGWRFVQVTVDAAGTVRHDSVEVTRGMISNLGRAAAAPLFSSGLAGTPGPFSIATENGPIEAPCGWGPEEEAERYAMFKFEERRALGLAAEYGGTARDLFDETVEAEQVHAEPLLLAQARAALPYRDQRGR